MGKWRNTPKTQPTRTKDSFANFEARVGIGTNN